MGPRNNAKVWSYIDLCSYVVAGQLDSSKNYKFGSYLPTAHMQQDDTDVLGHWSHTWEPLHGL